MLVQIQVEYEFRVFDAEAVLDCFRLHRRIEPIGKIIVPFYGTRSFNKKLKLRDPIPIVPPWLRCRFHGGCLRVTNVVVIPPCEQEAKDGVAMIVDLEPLVENAHAESDWEVEELKLEAKEHINSELLPFMLNTVGLHLKVTDPYFIEV